MGARNTPHGDSPRPLVAVRDLVDIAIDEDPRDPCLWAPTEYWEAFCQAVDRKPNLIGRSSTGIRPSVKDRRIPTSPRSRPN